MTELQQYLRDKRPDDVHEEEWNTYCRVLMHADPKSLLINVNGYRKYLWELRYFGSDISKFINLHCDRKMTVNNIDCAIYKRDEGRMRIIEFKGKKEEDNETQNELLNVLSSIAANSNHFALDVDMEIFTLRSDAPKFAENIITDFVNGEQYLLGNDLLKKWLNFKHELDESDLLNKQNSLF